VPRQDVAVVAAIVAAIAAVTVVVPSLGDDKPDVSPPPTGEVVEIHPDELDPAPDVAQDSGQPVTLRPGEPLACMFQVDCLMHQVEDATAGNPPRAAAPALAPTDTVPDELPPSA
jgi:hypothetical protein